MSETDIDTLARTLWGEARGEGQKGMWAVACVVLNRLAQPGWWGRTINDICLKPYQFSCWNKDNPNLKKMLTVTDADPQFQIALDIARAAVENGLEDTTNGANHYRVHTLAWPRDWGTPKPPVACIGNHIFYRL